MSVSPEQTQTVQVSGYRKALRVALDPVTGQYLVNFLVDPAEDDHRDVNLYAVTADNMEFDHDDPEQKPIEYVGVVELVTVPVFVFAQAT